MIILKVSSLPPSLCSDTSRSVSLHESSSPNDGGLLYPDWGVANGGTQRDITRSPSPSEEEGVKLKPGTTSEIDT